MRIVILLRRPDYRKYSNGTVKYSIKAVSCQCITLTEQSDIAVNKMIGFKFIMGI